jgi:hypothetical protein
MRVGVAAQLILITMHKVRGKTEEYRQFLRELFGDIEAGESRLAAINAYVDEDGAELAKRAVQQRLARL